MLLYCFCFLLFFSFALLFWASIISVEMSAYILSSAALYLISSHLRQRGKRRKKRKGRRRKKEMEGRREKKVCCCSLVKSCPTLCNPMISMNCSMPGFPVLHYIPELALTHVHWVNDAIQTSHPLSPPSPPALNLSQNQGLFQWAGSLH